MFARVSYWISAPGVEPLLRVQGVLAHTSPDVRRIVYIDVLYKVSRDAVERQGYLFDEQTCARLSGATSVAHRGCDQERGVSAITARPFVMDDLTADVLALFELVDNDRKDQLLDYWQQLFEKHRAAKAATA